MNSKKIADNITKSKEILNEDEELKDEINIRDAFDLFEHYMKTLSMRDPSMNREESIEDGKITTEYTRSSDTTHVTIVRPEYQKGN